MNEQTIALLVILPILVFVIAFNYLKGGNAKPQANIDSQSNTKYVPSVLPGVFLTLEIIIAIGGLITMFLAFANDKNILAWSAVTVTIVSMFSLAVLRSLFLRLNSIGEALNNLQNK